MELPSYFVVMRNHSSLPHYRHSVVFVSPNSANNLHINSYVHKPLSQAYSQLYHSFALVIFSPLLSEAAKVASKDCQYQIVKSTTIIHRIYTSYRILEAACINRFIASSNCSFQLEQNPFPFLKSLFQDISYRTESILPCMCREVSGRSHDFSFYFKFILQQWKNSINTICRCFACCNSSWFFMLDRHYFSII